MSVITNSLRHLLNSTETAHKKDINDYAHGHLNETRLLGKDVAFKKHRPWASANEPPLDLKPKGLLYKRDDGATREMSTAMFKFSVETQSQRPCKKKEKIQKSYPVRKSSDTQGSSSLYSVIDDDVLIEEYMVRTVKSIPTLPWINAGLTSSLKHSNKSINSGPQTCSSLKQKSSNKSDVHRSKVTYKLPLADTEFEDALKLRNDIAVPSLLHGATKRDQFVNQNVYNGHIVKARDCIKQDILSGKEMVYDLEMELKKNLQDLSFDDGGPTDEKLAVFQNSFGKLIQSSPTFSHILSTIKDEYERYLDHLRGVLNSTSHHELVQQQVQQMTAGGTSRPHEMEKARSRLEHQENVAQEALDKNQRLRDEMKLELKKETVDLSVDKDVSQLKRPKIMTADEIEHTKALILEKLDEVAVIKKHMKMDSVPTTVCCHLDNCIKETEIEVQKLLKQNEYLEQSIEENELLLGEAITDADTSERDTRRIWRRINSSRGLGSASFLGDDDDDCENEQSKWGWYIS